MLIHFSVFSLGVGHATRAIGISRELFQRGHSITFTASYEAAEFLRREGFQVTPVPMVGVGWRGDGGVSIGKTALNLLKAPSPFTAQVSVEQNSMKQADVVISDSKLSAILAARLSGKPCLLITNQLMVTLPSSARKMRTSIAEELGGFLLSAAWSLADTVIVPDLPPPYSISYLNLVHPLGARISHFIGPLVDLGSVTGSRRLEIASRFKLDSSRPTVFIQVTGHATTRAELREAGISAAEGLGKSFNVILAEGEPLGSDLPIREPWGWRMEWCPYTEIIMSMSDVVVSRAGHTTLSKALALGRPLVLAPIRNHSEQLGNANQATRLGVGKSLPEGGVTPTALERAVREVLQNESYRIHSKQIAELIAKLDPIRSLVGMVESLAGSSRLDHPKRQGN